MLATSPPPPPVEADGPRLNPPAFVIDLSPEPEPEPKPDPSFEMTLDYEPRNTGPGLTLQGATLIMPGEILTLVAAPGTSKTNVTELLAALTGSAASGVDVADSLGFAMPSAGPASRCLVVDMERTHDDVHTSLRRAWRRLGQDGRAVENGRLRGIEYRCFIEIAKVEERQAELVRLLENDSYDFLLIDGVIDLVADPNDIKEAAECVRWLRALASHYNLCVVCCIHPNPLTTKPVGHLGTFLCRWSRAVLLLAKSPDGGPRFITSDFDNGKLSHHNGKLVQGYDWCSVQTMFVSMEVVAPSAKHGPKKHVTPLDVAEAMHLSVLSVLLTHDKPVGFTALLSNLKTEFQKRGQQVGDNRGKDFINYWMHNGWIAQVGRPGTRAAGYVLGETGLTGVAA